MKTLLSKFSFFSILALTSFLFLSFTQGVVWLDENHNQVTQENGVFYRPIPEKKRSIYLIVDYYKNGNKYREGKAASFAVKNEGFKGYVTYFYSDGSDYKKEKYKNGVLDGSYKEYYPTGELKIDGVYDRGVKERAWKIYYKTGKIKTKGKYRNGEKVGEWTTFYRDVYYPDDE
jgi:antitoxin component YwqK of YwqJK toxin-antitoxin module|tara:strand:+ start:310 stop:831 length:522 start_codon:yes stop_codon:yes gene_type:complete